MRGGKGSQEGGRYNKVPCTRPPASRPSIGTSARVAAEAGSKSARDTGSPRYLRRRRRPGWQGMLGKVRCAAAPRLSPGSVATGACLPKSTTLLLPMCFSIALSGGLAGRPKGKPNRERISLRDRIRMSEAEIVDRLIFLMRKGENHTVQLAACRELLDRGYGRPMQVAAVGIGNEGGPATIIVHTGVPRRVDGSEPRRALPPLELGD